MGWTHRPVSLHGAIVATACLGAAGLMIAGVTEWLLGLSPVWARIVPGIALGLFLVGSPHSRRAFWKV